MTERGISVKPQSQGVMIDQHQKWEHKIEWPQEEEEKVQEGITIINLGTLGK